jgi:hypothetical protein
MPEQKNYTPAEVMKLLADNAITLNAHRNISLDLWPFRSQLLIRLSYLTQANRLSFIVPAVCARRQP